MSIAEFRLEGGTLMVPGHGRLVDSADVAYYRDMLTIIRDRVEDMVKKGETLEQVKAANPSGDYDTEYGSTTGAVDDGQVHRSRLQEPRRREGAGASPQDVTGAGTGLDRYLRRWAPRRSAPVVIVTLALIALCGVTGSAQQGGRGQGAPAAAQRRRRRSTSPASGSRSSPTTGGGGW